MASRRVIYGVGVDICQVSRIKALVLKSEYHQKRFLSGTFHQIEQDEFFAKEEERVRYEYLASRWALKEAMVKATGRTDLEYKGMYLKKPFPVESNG
jgi:holo-[acyl-carrier protein] synthase